MTKAWTAAEDERIRAIGKDARSHLRPAGGRAAFLAQEFGRTPAAVRMRAVRLGVPLRGMTVRAAAKMANISTRTLQRALELDRMERALEVVRRSA